LFWSRLLCFRSRTARPGVRRYPLSGVPPLWEQKKQKILGPPFRKCLAILLLTPFLCCGGRPFPACVRLKVRASKKSPFWLANPRFLPLLLFFASPPRGFPGFFFSFCRGVCLGPRVVCQRGPHFFFCWCGEEGRFVRFELRKKEGFFYPDNTARDVSFCAFGEARPPPRFPSPRFTLGGPILTLYR